MARAEQSKAWDKVLATIEEDREELIELCLLLGRIPSRNGKERTIAETVVEWLKDNGIESYLQPITEESANAIGVLRGTGEGRSLICDAHIDTSLDAHYDTSLVGSNEIAQKMDTGFVEGELIYGHGIVNDKAQVAAFMIAARALKKAGVRLKGDLTVAAVAFETGEPSVDEFQGINYPGEGFGSRWMIDRGVVADYGLIGETSGFGIIAAECGCACLKITVFGREVYTPRVERGKTWQENPNAIVKSAQLILILEEWARKYEDREKVEFYGGLIIPKAQVTGIRMDRAAGGAGSNCNIYIDVRLSPGADPKVIHKEISRLTHSTGIECEVKLYQWSRGYIAQKAEPLIDALKAAHKYIFGTDPPNPPSAEVSMWRDLNAFNEVNIPSVCYGPPRQKEQYSDAQNRVMKISDLVAATKVYAITIMQVCGLSS